MVEMREIGTAEPAVPVLSVLTPQKVELGRALGARTGDATRLAAQAAAAAGLSELASRRFAKPIRHVHNVATHGIANLLMTGQGSTEKERNFIGKLGVRAAAFGLPVATLTRCYLLWRDANLHVLEEEVKRLGTVPAVSGEAQAIIRSTADIGIVRLARAYDHQMHVVGHREDSVTLALRDSQAQLQVAVLAGSKKNAELSAALAEISRKNRSLEGVNRQQSVFIANVSHELRTPLAGILGHVEMLLGGMSGELGGDQRQDVLAVEASGQMLRSLLDDILDESQIEAGTMQIKAGRVDLKTAIESVLASARPLADAKNLYVRADITKGAHVLGDDSRLKQILSNLIGNAIKFTDAGGVTVNCLPWAGFWRVSVADTGIGLPESSQRTVFERFVQLDASITRRFAGLGLGLSIVKGLVLMQGGEIGVDSTLGEGSTFWFTVPSFHDRPGAPGPRAAG